MDNAVFGNRSHSTACLHSNINLLSCIQCGQIQMQAKSITLTYQVLGVTERGLTTLNKIQHIIAPELFQVNEILGHMDAT